MTVSTLRPNGTASTAGSPTVVSAASAHAALSDDSTASYVEFDAAADQVQVSIADLTLPAAAVIKQLGVRCDVARPLASANAPLTVRLGLPSTVASETFLVSIIAVHTVQFVHAASVTDTAADAAVISLIGSGGTTVRVFEAYLDVTYVEQPVVSVDEPSATVTNSNRPTVEWSTTLDADGGAQTHYEVRLFTDAQYGAGGFDPATSTATDESGITAGTAASWQGSALLADDTYRAYVRVAQTVNGEKHWSAWDNIQFDLAVDLPAVPSMTLANDDANARIEIDLTDNAGDATTDYFEVQNSTDGGTTWTTIRGLRTDDLIAPDGSGDAITYDYEAPEGTTISYRARAAHDYSGVLAYSAWSSTATETWSSARTWLKHLLDPSLNLSLHVRAFAETQRPARQGVFQPLGATLAIVISDTRTSATGTITFRTDTAAERDDLDTLVAANTVILLQLPASFDEPDRYVILGDHTRARIEGLPPTAPQRLDTFVWRQVAAPDGVVTEWPA